eukprot:Gb_19502 [translate_table: standard]
MSKSNIPEPSSAILPHFVCPISMEIMVDPVTLCTGHTYDRPSIEKWLRLGHKSCPVTMLHLHTTRLTPNHALSRFIQQWCTTHQAITCASPDKYNSRFATDDQQQLRLLLDDIRSEVRILESLHKLRKLAKKSASNRAHIILAGAVLVLEPLLQGSANAENNSMDVAAVATDIVGCLPLRDEDKRTIVQKSSSSIAWLLGKNQLAYRMNAAVLLRRLCSSEEFVASLGCTPGIMDGVVNILRNYGMLRELRFGLRALKALCSMNTGPENKSRAVQAGAIGALIHLLDHPEERIFKRAIGVVALLCRVQEGRDAVEKHTVGVRSICGLLVGSVPLRVTECAVSALWSVVCCTSASDIDRNIITLRMELMKAGAVGKLFQVLQRVDCGCGTKHLATDILRSTGLLQEICRSSLEATKLNKTWVLNRKYSR